MRYTPWLAVLLLVFTQACSGVPISEPTPTPQDTPIATSPPAPTPTTSPTAVGPTTIELWLPPEFDPNSGNQAGDILKTRLEEFTARRPNTRVDVRLKAIDGPGGMLDSLTTASAAAPLALPDIVALPRPVLEAAALKGLLRPLDDLIEPIDNSDWYDFARQMAHVQNSTYGLPFAGDAQVLVYRTTTIPEPPRTLSETMAAAGTLLFSAADPQAMFTLTQYQANGGAILDDQGRPYLEPLPLTEVLTYYQSASSRGLIPIEATQFEDDEQVWEAYSDSNAAMMVTWNSHYLNNMEADSAAAPLPTEDGQPFTLATGWLWALASPEPENQQLSAELAEFLNEGDFLGRWTSALGYLPPRPSAMTNWGTATQRRFANEIVTTAQLIPAEDVLSSLSPLLKNATLDVLKQQTDPLVAAREAVYALTNP